MMRKRDFHTVEQNKKSFLPQNMIKQLSRLKSRKNGSSAVDSCMSRKKRARAREMLGECEMK